MWTGQTSQIQTYIQRSSVKGHLMCMYNVFVWISEELSIDGIACIEFFNKFRYINEIITIIQMSFIHQTFIWLGYKKCP